MKSRCSTALACYSSGRFQAELFLNGPGQTGNLGAENRQQIIHSDNSEKVSMFIDYRETANAPVMHKPHGIEQVVIDVDHRRVRSHYLLYCGLRRLFSLATTLSTISLSVSIPIGRDSSITTKQPMCLDCISFAASSTVAFGEIVTTVLLHILSRLMKHLRNRRKNLQEGEATLMPPEKLPTLLAS